jgi:hypothetical protein
MELAIGAKVMIDSINLLPEYGLANCSMGKIIDILYKPNK